MGAGLAAGTATRKVAQAAAKARAELDRGEEDYRRTLSQLRNARRLTQVQLAAILGVSQAPVSRVENQADLYLSTLRSYVQAMGGEPELRAVFPDGQAVAITLPRPERSPVITGRGALPAARSCRAVPGPLPAAAPRTDRTPPRLDPPGSGSPLPSCRGWLARAPRTADRLPPGIATAPRSAAFSWPL